MKPLIFLFLILTTISNIKGNYSINALLNYLLEKGLYDLLVEVKTYFGTDVSISFCKQLVENSDCDTVVRVYIGANGSRPDCPDEDREANKKKANQIINEYRIALLKAGYSLDEIDKMLEILLKTA